MAAVALDSVTKTYRRGRVVALDGVTLAVADGERLVVVGPSGGGKTTLLRLVAGLDAPSRGTIRIDGEAMDGVAPRRRGVGMVLQDASLYPHLTARGNLGFPLRMQRMARAEIDARVRTAAADLGLTALLDRRPFTLSGGERQRVAVGRLLVARPRCALLDEPLARLDAPRGDEVREALRTLHARLGTTVIHVTHDQEEAMRLADRIAVLVAGRLLQVGTPDEVYDAPANRYVAGFFGRPPMSFFEGGLERAGLAGAVFDDGGGLRVALPGAPPDVTGPVVLGVRPEAWRRAESGTAHPITAHVTAVERLGPACDVYAKTAAGAPLVTRLETRSLDETVRPGASLALAVAADHVHVFEPGPHGARRAGRPG